MVTESFETLNSSDGEDGIDHYIAQTTRVDVVSHENLEFATGINPESKLFESQIPLIHKKDPFGGEDGLVLRMVHLLQVERILVPSRNVLRGRKLEFPSGFIIGTVAETENGVDLSLLGDISTDRVGRLQTTYVGMKMVNKDSLLSFLNDLNSGRMNFFIPFMRKWFTPKPNELCELDSIPVNAMDQSSFPASRAKINDLIVGEIRGTYPAVDSNSQLTRMLIDSTLKTE